MIPSPAVLIYGIEQPAWCPRWLWHPLTWLCHGAIQACAYWFDPGFGWGLLAMWYYRDKGQHAQKPVTRWNLDALMDVGTPILVQIALTIWGLT